MDFPVSHLHLESNLPHDDCWYKSLSCYHSYFIFVTSPSHHKVKKTLYWDFSTFSILSLVPPPHRILEKEILAVKKNHEHEKEELKGQINELKKDNGRQQIIIGKVILVEQ